MYTKKKTLPIFLKNNLYIIALEKVFIACVYMNFINSW